MWPASLPENDIKVNPCVSLIFDTLPRRWYFKFCKFSKRMFHNSCYWNKLEVHIYVIRFEGFVSHWIEQLSWSVLVGVPNLAVASNLTWWFLEPLLSLALENVSYPSYTGSIKSRTQNQYTSVSSMVPVNQKWYFNKRRKLRKERTS